MFNHTGIKKTTYGGPVQILFNVQNQLSVGIRVDDAYYVERDGRKVVPAGTPLYGDLTNRSTAFVKATTESAVIGETGAISDASYEVSVFRANAVGVLLHDVDVTDGDNNGTLLIWGYVDLNKLDSTTAPLITEEVMAALAGKVTFLK